MRRGTRSVRVQFSVTMNRIFRPTALLALALAALILSSAGSEPAAPFARVGIVPLRDEGNVRNGAQRLTKMLRARLAAHYEDVDFFIVDLEDTDIPPGPLLLKEAVELCDRTGADALLEGVFGGVEVVGGTWPNRGSDFPMARGYLSWRLVEGSGGMLVSDGKIDPDKPKVYSERIRSTKELQTRVLQDLADGVAAALEDCKRLPSTEDTGD